MSDTQPKWQDDDFLSALVDLEFVAQDDFRRHPRCPEAKLAWAAALDLFAAAVMLWRDRQPSTGDPE